MLRRHQADVNRIVQSADIGLKLIVIVTPGGGKSAIPVITAHHLIRRGVLDKLCWVVPRDSLRTQGEDAFAKEDMRLLVGHSLEARAAGNDIDPTRGAACYVTTYQAIQADQMLHRKEFDRHRYGLVLDEVQHVREQGDWHAALQPLVDRCKYLVLMSGTPSRAGGQRIAFMDYGEDDGDRREPLLITDSKTRRVVQYTRRDALREKAIIPVHFNQTDGLAEWEVIGKDARYFDKAMLSEAGDDTSRAIWSALKTDYARQLLFRCVQNWQQQNSVTRRRGKLLVVAAAIKEANTYLKWLRDEGVVADIAVSRDVDDEATTKKAKRNIDRLKGIEKPELDVLVTVAMAYEGLDCPAITHIACLTHIRSKEWIEQMIARAVRVDPNGGPWASQAAYVYAPADELFNECIAEIREAQNGFAVIPLNDGRGGGPPDDPDVVVPQRSHATDSFASDLETGEVIDPAELRFIEEEMANNKVFGPPNELVKIFRKWRAGGKQQDHKAGEAEAAPLRKSQRERALRAEITALIARRARAMGNGSDLGIVIPEINTSIMRRFNKSREVMTEDELRACLRFVRTLAMRPQRGAAE